MKWTLLVVLALVVMLVVLRLVVGTAVLVSYTGTLEAFAEVAAKESMSRNDLVFLRSGSVVVHSTGALILLLAATLLAVYKPKGLTRRGHQLRQPFARSSD